jgi:hypothetical protein
MSARRTAQSINRAAMGVLLAFSAIWLGIDAATAQGGGSSGAEKIYAELSRLPAEERTRRIEDGARREGKLVLIHTMRGSQAAAHVDLFRHRYPFLALDVTSDIGSQDAAERLTAEEIVGRHLTDVVNVALPDMGELVRRKLVARFSTPATAAILPKYRGFIDPQSRWTPWYWSEHGISYNSDLVPADKSPKGWLDLCNPFFKGGVSFDPAETRYLSGLYAMLGEAGTEKLLACLGANDPIIQRGHAQRMELMLAGDHLAQGDNYFYQGVAIKRKNPRRRSPSCIRRRYWASPASSRSTGMPNIPMPPRCSPTGPCRRRARSSSAMCCAGQSPASIPSCPTTCRSSPTTTHRRTSWSGCLDIGTSPWRSGVDRMSLASSHRRARPAS